MKYLLDNKLAPLTFRWGFLEMPFEQTVGAVRQWRSTVGIPTSLRPTSGILAEMLPALAPLTLPPRRELLVPTQSPWTAYFDNSTLGGDPLPPIGHLSSSCRCRGLGVSCKPQIRALSAASQEGAAAEVSFTLFSPHQTDWLNVLRSIELVRDRGRWRFLAKGTPQPFESLDEYGTKDRKERFTPAMLERYCAALGVRLFDPDFYLPRGMLVEMLLPLGAKAPQRTLEEARALAGF